MRAPSISRYQLLAVALSALSISIFAHTRRPIVGLATTGQGDALQRLVQGLEGRITDALFRLRGPAAPHPDVVIVQLDERGAQRWGLWPWPREVMAGIIERLLAARPSVIGLDVAFTDEVAGAGPDVRAAVEALAEVADPRAAAARALLEGRLAADRALAGALQRAGTRLVQGVVPYTPQDRPSFSDEVVRRWSEQLAPHVIQVPGRVKGSFFDLTTLSAFRLAGVQGPLPHFAAAGNRMAHFATLTDVDGTIRQVASLAVLDEPPGLLPSLGTAVAAAHLEATIVPRVEASELAGFDLVTPSGSISVPFQPAVALTAVNYPGPLKVFPSLSAVEVFDGTFPPEQVGGKIVLVGNTISGSSGDQRVTPFEELAPGVVTHAALASNILRQDFLTRPDLAWAAEALAMVLLAMWLAMLLPRVRFVTKLAIIAATVGGWSAVTAVAFTSGVRLSAVVPVLHLAVTSFALVFLGYLSVDREKLQLKNTFSRYLGAEVIDVALTDPDKLNRGEKREMTVLFSDIRGFTSLAERMSPETLAAFINSYLSPMTRIVFEERGTLDKYIGDAVMAFWNAPLDQPHHALLACRAAVKMLERLDVLKGEWRAVGLPELEIGVGISSGPMVVGNMGSDVRVDYTVLGDAVNLGSRLEGTTKEYEVRAIISEATHAQVVGQVVARRLGAVRVKGRRVPIGIYELRGIGAPSPAEGDVIGRFERALEAFEGRRFEEARGGFAAVLEAWPHDRPARKYLAAVEEFLLSPPDGTWDGVITMRTK